MGIGKGIAVGHVLTWNGSAWVSQAGSGGGGGADPNASYIVVGVTGSLPNERSLFATNGIIGVDGGAGNPYGISIDDSVVATLSGSTFTGNVHFSGSVSDFTATGSVKFNSGLSGSLTRLTDDTSYLVAGTGISITSASNGQVTIINDGTVGDITSVIAGTGLSGGGTSGDITLDINDSTVATVSGTLFTGNIGVPNLYSSGVVTASLGLSGSLTRLVDGSSYLIAGTGVTLASASNGSVTISAPDVGDITSVTAGTGLTGGGTTGAVTLNIDDSVIATISGSAFTGNVSVPNLYSSGVVTASLGLSGSLTKLTNSTSYLVAGTGISIASASNGQVTITNDGTVGDITSVTAGAGLTGGGTTGNITLDIDDSVVATVSGTTFTGNIISPNLYAIGSVTGSTLFATTNVTSSYAELGIGSIASTGEVRLPNNSAIVARNSTDTQDVSLISLDSNDDMHIGDGATNPDNMTLDVASTAVFRIAGGYKLAILSTYLDVVLPSIIFRDSTSNPTLKQGDSTSATKGAPLAIQAQTSTAGSSTGGNLSLAAGAGTINNGDIQLSGSIISLTGSVETDGNNSITLDANAASRFLVDGANLTLSASSADIVVNASAGSTFGYSLWTNWGGHYHSSSQEININTPTLKIGGLTPLTTLQMTGSGGGALWSATGWHTASFGASRFELFGTDGVFLKGGAQSSAGLSDGFIVASGSSEVTTFLSNFGAGSQSIIGAINSAYSAGGGGGTGADPNASYIVVAATASLPNERSLFATNGIIAADGGAGNPYGISIDDSVVATVSGSTFTGAVNFNSGLSGSLTQLTDGTSYLKAGNNVTITSASNGAVTVAGTSGTVSFLPTGSLYSLIHNLSGAHATTTTTTAFTAGVQFVPLRENRIITGVRMWNSHSAPRNFKCSLWNKDEARVAVTAQQITTGEAFHTIPFGTSSYTIAQEDVGKLMYVSFYYESGTEYPYSDGGVMVPAVPFIADNHFVYTNLRKYGSGDSVPTSGASQNYMIEPIFATVDETT